MRVKTQQLREGDIVRLTKRGPQWVASYYYTGAGARIKLHQIGSNHTRATTQLLPPGCGAPNSCPAYVYWSPQEQERPRHLGLARLDAVAAMAGSKRRAAALKRQFKKRYGFTWEPAFIHNYSMLHLLSESLTQRRIYRHASRTA